MKNLIFLCIASAVFIFSVIVLNFAPTINGLIGKGTYLLNGNRIYPGWDDSPYRAYSDNYNLYKDEPVTAHWSDQEDKDYHLDHFKRGKK